MLGSRRFYS